MALRTDTAQYLEKWGRRTQAAVPDYRTGVERVTEAPGVKAAQAADRMRIAINESLDSGKWQRNVAAVSLQDWKESAIEKGAGRISAGVTASLSKNRGKIDKLLADVEATVNEVDRMPNASLQDRINRMVAYANGMHDRSQQ